MGNIIVFEQRNGGEAKAIATFVFTAHALFFVRKLNTLLEDCNSDCVVGIAIFPED